MIHENKVRMGIIGLGNIGQHHASYLSAGKINRGELVAVADAFPEKLSQYKSLKTFGTGEELIDSGAVDAVIIATPHYQHTTLGIAALKRGLHVMVEKPISAHKADAERLIAAHEKNSALVFAGMFQMRIEPRYQKIRQMVQGGELGKIVRASWIMTDWYRTEAYYASGDWRGTWKGEGGGVLLNQCLHNLDLLQWLLGMPSSVRGFCQLGQFHDIEVEDNVTAFVEYENGATGTFVSSTGEAPGTNRFEIAGSRGKLLLEGDKLTFTRNESDMLSFSKSAKLGFSKPDVQNVQIPIENAANPHAAFVQNFVNAILDCDALVAPGAEGIHSVELANAILFSSLTGQTIHLPMDSAAYEERLKRLIAGSTKKTKVVQGSSEDFVSSFRR
jgi:predicted dehydrogenase